MRIVENTYPSENIYIDSYKKYAVREIGSCEIELRQLKPKGYTVNITFEIKDATGLIITAVEKDRPDNVVVLPIKFGKAK